MPLLVKWSVCFFYRGRTIRIAIFDSTYHSFMEMCNSFLVLFPLLRQFLLSGLLLDKSKHKLPSEMLDSFRVIHCDNYYLSFLYSNDDFLLCFDSRLFSGFF